MRVLPILTTLLLTFTANAKDKLIHKCLTDADADVFVKAYQDMLAKVGGRVSFTSISSYFVQLMLEIAGKI